MLSTVKCTWDWTSQNALYKYNFIILKSYRAYQREIKRRFTNQTKIYLVIFNNNLFGYVFTAILNVTPFHIPALLCVCLWSVNRTEQIAAFQMQTRSNMAHKEGIFLPFFGFYNNNRPAGSLAASRCEWLSFWRVPFQKLWTSLTW